jgi:16S rRNA (guanine527-N7)-methyltransferase
MNQFYDLLKERIGNGLPIDEDRLNQLCIYAQELKDWNTRINLTAIKEDSDIVDKHFIDSLLIFCFEEIIEGARIADVGSGGGFPGIPIKIYRPDIKLSLIESIAKKTRFLYHVVDTLKLDNVEVINERAEAIGQSKEHRETYDIVVARTVARLPILAEYCLPLVSVGGKFIAYKGQESEVEVEEAKNAIEKLGGRFIKIERDEVNPERRSLIFIEKVKDTPIQYPRQAGKIEKKPFL